MPIPTHPLKINGKVIRRALEIGAGDSYSSELISYGSHVETVELWEPNYILARDLLDKASGNVITHFAAIGDFTGKADLYSLGYSSYLAGAPSFIALSVEEGSPERFWAPLVQDVFIYSITDIDHGDIDLLVLTCHGSELAILNKMVSRPVCIRTKYYCHNHRHWEYYTQITHWMAKHGYTHKVLETNQHGTFFHIEWTKI